MNLYPEIEPYNTHFISVSNLHTIYVEESGNKHGIPIIFLHGGPGGGIEPIYRRYFNPEKYKIIILDQRGCGKSIPHAELCDNTTWDLVDDLEKIRKYLNINKWVIFGGSWGSTLGLTYAITNPNSCLGLILRGIFLIRKKEIDWFYQNGASKIFPEFWKDYTKLIPKNEHNDLLSAYYNRLTGKNKKLQISCAKAWALWEARTSKLLVDNNFLHKIDDEFALAFSKIECHYFINRGFFKSDNWLINNCKKINQMKCIIIHGRYDMVCPFENAWELHQALNKSTLKIIPNAGHSMLEPGIKEALIKATDEFEL